MIEISTLLAEIAGTRQVNADELATARDSMSLGLTGAWATGGGIASYLMDQQVYGLSNDYYTDYPGNVAKVTLNAVNTEAVSLLAKRPLTWIVVGDRSKIESGIRALNLGEVHVIDADGKPIP